MDVKGMTAKASVDWIEWARPAKHLPTSLVVEIPVGEAVVDGRLDWDKAAGLMMVEIEDAAGGAKCDACSWDFTGESVKAMQDAGIDLGEPEA